ncbi:myocyte-specific enhancer factor 2A homolog isoform X2 [Alosa sapidissima]|uniref:myocyte-specific enhancer factor 2A homolog isoform X2 n=1 Tax=Alosa sapidissima TaxID=34773 RepID=UPI001C0A174E|nr:myocyte-specific enhancer factor 2A homolog isoform X2 [Alosa sapidissima]
MGRKKIQITRIMDERNRQVTFTKRKFGLMKKAYELSVLCDCEIALIIFNSANKLFQYASTDMDKVLLKYTEYNEPHESRTNSDIVEKLRHKGQDDYAIPVVDESYGLSPELDDESDVMCKHLSALNKKEHRGCDSPDLDASYVLTPHTEEKYKKINEEFDNMMRNHKIPSGMPQQNFSMHGTLPVTNHNPLAYSSGGSLGHSASLSDAGVLSSPHGSLHRNMGSPGISQRPPSTGAAGSMLGASDMPMVNGSISSQVVNGFVGNTSGNSLGKGMPAKSPSPPGGNLNVSGRKPDLRVATGKGMMHPLNAQRINSSQTTQSLATPVVSVNTPSLPHQGLIYSTMASTYNSDYQLNSSELSNLQGFSLTGGLSTGSSPSWQHQQMAHGPPSSQGGGNHLPQGANLSVSTSHNVNIKSEPISPPRGRGGASSGGFMGAPAQGQAPAPSRQDVGRSPADSLSSSCSSYEGSDREEHRPDFLSNNAGLGRGSGGAGGEDQHSPSAKRLRIDSWVT